ncbi:hypothetical protein HY251_10990 [bacterium]|nr:hypothetical protein [bacterium]
MPDQDTVKIDVLIELLISKGVITREDYTNALNHKLGIAVKAAKQPRK